MSSLNNIIGRSDQQSKDAILHNCVDPWPIKKSNSKKNKNDIDSNEVSIYLSYLLFYVYILYNPGRNESYTESLI